MSWKTIILIAKKHDALFIIQLTHQPGVLATVLGAVRDDLHPDNVCVVVDLAHHL